MKYAFVAFVLAMFAVFGAAGSVSAADVQCRHGDRDPCFVVETEVRGFVCEPLVQEDLTSDSVGGPDVAAAIHTAQVACAAEASHALFGEVAFGDYDQEDGGDRFTIRPAEVRVTRAERVH